MGRWVYFEDETCDHPCPHCPRPKTPPAPFDNPNCICGKPLWMVIPPEGISCPVHPHTRFYGPQITFQTQDYSAEFWEKFQAYQEGKLTLEDLRPGPD